MYNRAGQPEPDIQMNSTHNFCFSTKQLYYRTTTMPTDMELTVLADEYQTKHFSDVALYCGEQILEGKKSLPETLALWSTFLVSVLSLMDASCLLFLSRHPYAHFTTFSL